MPLLCPAHATASGCKPCPEGTSFQGSQEIAFDGVIFGHFLSPASDDAIVSASGCEPHAAGFGGSYLLNRTAGRWRVLWYKPAILTVRCKKTLLRGGRNGLVCLTSDMHGGVADDGLSTWDLAEQDPQPKFFFTTIDTVMNCRSDPGRTSREEIERVDVSDGKLVVTAGLAKKRLTRKQCAAVEDGNEAEMDRLLPLKHYRIEYAFDGSTYKPVPASAAEAALFGPAP